MPPGVEILTSLRGVEGAKKGEAGGLVELLAMVGGCLLCSSSRLGLVWAWASGFVYGGGWRKVQWPGRMEGKNTQHLPDFGH